MKTNLFRFQFVGLHCWLLLLVVVVLLLLVVLLVVVLVVVLLLVVVSANVVKFVCNLSIRQLLVNQ